VAAGRYAGLTLRVPTLLLFGQRDIGIPLRSAGLVV